MKILVFGCGKMGMEMVKKLSVDHYVKVVDIVKLKLDGVEFYTDISQIVDFIPDMVIFAVKPQQAQEVLNVYKNSSSFSEEAIYFSIIAGKKISFFEENLGNIKICRAMPNLPIAVDEGLIAYVLSQNFTTIDEEKILSLEFGEFVKVENESQMDLITAISGSGPAYFMLFAQYMIDIAMEMGFDGMKARKIVLQTCFGAAKMMKTSNSCLYDMIDAVKSKGGTTEAGIAELSNDDALKTIIRNTITKATEKSVYLSVNDQ